MRGYIIEIWIYRGLQVGFCHYKNSRHAILAHEAVRLRQKQQYANLIELSVILSQGLYSVLIILSLSP